MFIKSLLAAAIITVTAVVWQVKYLPAKGSASLGLARASSRALTPPSWIENPESFFGGARQGVLVATGSAKIHGNQSMALNQAMLKARMKLVKAKGAATRSSTTEEARALPNGETERTVRSSNSTTARSTTTSPSGTITFERVDGTLTGTREIARWTSPEGVLWVLVASSL